MAIMPIRMQDADSLCRHWTALDCQTARNNLFNRDKWAVSTVVSKCPKDCSICLYKERFSRDDANWIPELDDPQYRHWWERN